MKKTVFALFLSCILLLSACVTYTDVDWRTGAVPAPVQETKQAGASNDDVVQVPGEAEFTAYEIYVQALETTNAYESARLSILMAMSMEMAGVGSLMDIDINMNVAQAIVDETNLTLEMAIDTEVLGQASKVVAYYTDGIYYMDADGVKTQMPMTVEEASAQYNMIDMESLTDVVMGQDYEETEDGYVISMTIPGDLMTDSLSLGGVMGMTGGMTDELGDITISDVDLQVLIGRDYIIKSIEMAFSMGMIVMDLPVDLVIQCEVNYLELGEVVIELPDDLDTYLPVDSIY